MIATITQNQNGSGSHAMSRQKKRPTKPVRLYSDTIAFANRVAGALETDIAQLLDEPIRAFLERKSEDAQRNIAEFTHKASKAKPHA